MTAIIESSAVEIAVGFPPNMHIKVVVSQLAHAYGVNIVNPGQLGPIEKISRPTLDAAFDAVDDFRGACGRQFNLLLNFLRALDQGGNAAAKLLALKQINLAFGCQVSLLPNPPLLARWTAFGAACGGVAAAARPHLARFYQSRNANTAVTDIEAIFNAANGAGHGAQALEVMKIVMERNGSPAGITPMAIGAICNMLAAHRPMSGFMGFTQWGPGESPDPDTNLDVHVLKHVCFHNPDPDFGVSEAVSFWDTFHVRLTAADFEQLAVNPLPQARLCFDGAQPLRGDRLKRFLVYRALENQPALTQFVKNQALIPYRDFAIETSRVMTNVIVQSNGTRVFISGSAGDAFIIGRFEGLQLGISSCYRPLDINEKLQGARSNMCWPLR